METNSQKPVLRDLLILGLPALILLSTSFTGCAQQEPGAYARDDYFGGQGNLRPPTHHVPREVQRTEPWLPLF